MQKNKGSTVFFLIIILLILVTGGVYIHDLKKDIKQIPETTEKVDEVTVQKSPEKVSVTLLSPNGGEVFKVGDKVAIRWKTLNYSKGIVYLRLADKDGSTVLKDITSGLTGTPNSGQYVWDIGPDIRQGEYRLVVQTIDSQYAYDNSDKTFSVTTNDSDKPAITNITPARGPVGTIFKVEGNNLAGFEGDVDILIENSAGMTAYVTRRSGSSFEIKDKLCTKNVAYSGLPCDSYMNIVPGTYKLYAIPWGKVSNKVEFVVTNN